MKVTIFGSGSTGNCYLLDNGEHQLIIEAGIQFKKVAALMKFDFSRVVGLLITHEHGDHSKYLNDFIKHTSVPIYATLGTFEALGRSPNDYRLNVVKHGSQVEIKSFKVTPFTVQHDVAEPVGFLIDNQSQERLVYVTDTYYVKYRFKNVTHMMVEMNYSYQIAMENVNNGRLHTALKNRVQQSHFELKNALDFIKANMSPQLQKIWIIHVSSTNGDPALFKRETQALTGVPVNVLEH